MRDEGKRLFRGFQAEQHLSSDSQLQSDVVGLLAKIQWHALSILFATFFL